MIVTPAFDLSPAQPLSPGDAAAAIIHTGDGRYLLQHRDALRTIFYPDHWGCFGGGIENGESPLDALRRELREELNSGFGECPIASFGQFRFEVKVPGVQAFERHYYEIRIEPGAVQALSLGEGAGMALIDGASALHQLRLVPYDAFALWLHRYQGMLAGR